MQEAKQNSIAKEKSINPSKINDNSAYVKVTEEKAEDIISQINNEFNIGEKEILTEQNYKSENPTNRLDLNITTLQIESNKNQNQKNSDFLPVKKSRKLYFIVLLFFVVICGSAFGIFFGLNTKKEENLNLNAKHLDSNSFFQEKIKEKAAEEPVIVRNFQIAESYLYHKTSKSVIYRSINASDRNVTQMDSYISFFVAEKNENGHMKIFYELQNLTQHDLNKDNTTTLVFNSFDINRRKYILKIKFFAWLFCSFSLLHIYHYVNYKFLFLFVIQNNVIFLFYQLS